MAPTMAPTDAPTPVTILTGFLGSGKTTLILALLPQLPPDYKVCLLKNEFGDVAVDSQLAAQQAVSGVTELLNGCICCNLTGQLGDALAELRRQFRPDRILIETSGSAFPATLAMEVNRLAREQDGGGRYALDGVVSVVDVENWQGYEDTSVTAKLQAQFTDLVVFNKWEQVGERRFDDCLDRLGDLEVQTPWVKSDRGRVPAGVILGIDGALAAKNMGGADGTHGHDGEHDHSHSEEVEVLSITLQAPDEASGSAIDAARLRTLLQSAPKDEIYRIKGVVHAREQLFSSDSDASQNKPSAFDQPQRYILNWAFGRWTFTPLDGLPAAADPVARLTVISARYESAKWKKRIETDRLVSLAGTPDGLSAVSKVG